MNNSDKTPLLAFIIVVMLMFAIAGVERIIRNQNKMKLRADTVYTYSTIIKPVAKTDTVLKWDTMTITRNRIRTDIQLIHDTVTDSIDVAVPISSKTYDDSTYHAVISGYRPSLDTMIVRQRTITNTITRTQTKTQRLGLGVSAGYDPINNRPSVMVGINYNILGIK